MKARSFALTAALVAAVGVTPALAFFGPMPVIDVDSISKEATQIQNQLSQIEQAKQQVQADVQNLARVPTSYQAVQVEVAAIAQTGNAVAAEARATVAAGTVVQDSSEQAAETARLNGLAARANGNAQQQQVTNGYLAQQTNLLEQGNVLQAQAQLQRQAEEAAGYQGLANAANEMQAAGQDL